MKARVFAALGLVGCCLLSGCVDNAPGDLSASAAAELEPAVQDVRDAAATGSFADLKDAVASLKDLVDREERAGDVSPERANAIEDAADALVLDARPSPKPTPLETSLSPTPSPTESPTPSESPSESPSPSESSSPSPTDSPIVSASVGTNKSPKSSPSP